MITRPHKAEVAELADARDSKSRDRKVMGVRPPPSAFILLDLQNHVFRLSPKKA
jgi:hypothetical protein